MPPWPGSDSRRRPRSRAGQGARACASNHLDLVAGHGIVPCLRSRCWKAAPTHRVFRRRPRNARIGLPPQHYTAASSIQRCCRSRVGAWCGHRRTQPHGSSAMWRKRGERTGVILHTSRARQATRRLRASQSPSRRKHARRRRRATSANPWRSPRGRPPRVHRPRSWRRGPRQWQAVGKTQMCACSQWQQQRLRLLRHRWG
mmetsp:Transcript_63394/g.181914  ORF Transcript_63394/g.181914 Transcript_63394/m.181914 type:complete len:201 (+) Transcript_63394:1158-1760(+)